MSALCATTGYLYNLVTTCNPTRQLRSVPVQFFLLTEADAGLRTFVEGKNCSCSQVEWQRLFCLESHQLLIRHFLDTRVTF